MVHEFTLGEAAHLRNLARHYGLGEWSYNVRKQVFSSLRKKKLVVAHPQQLANFVVSSIQDTKKKADDDEAWIKSIMDLGAHR